MQEQTQDDLTFTWQGALLGVVAYIAVALIVTAIFI